VGGEEQGNNFSHQITKSLQRTSKGEKEPKEENPENCYQQNAKHQNSRDAEAAVTSIIFFREYSRICQDGWTFTG
jgi:hypothetical protein